MITAELLDALVRRYAPAADQKCVVCGAPLQFSTTDVGRPYVARYNCSSDDASPVRSTKPFHDRLRHYQASAWYDRGQTDLAVVELVKAYRELEPRAACPCFDESAERQLREDGDRWADPRDTRGRETDG